MNRKTENEHGRSRPASEPDRHVGAADDEARQGGALPEGEEPAASSPDAEEPPAGETPERAAAVESAPDYRDRWLRAEAELQNYRKRAQREREEGRRAAEESVMLEIMAALDDLERALEAARGQGAAESWTQGVALVTQRLRDYLARQGVTIVDPMGEPFDPNVQDALLEVDAPEGVAPGTVLQVIHKGYARGARALRPARVV